MYDLSKKLKTLIVGTVLAVFALALVSPAKDTLAQSVAFQEPDPTIPLNADWDACIQDYFRELSFPVTTIPGAAIVKQTEAELQTKMMTCVAERAQNEKEWWYRRAQYIKNEWGMRFMTSIYGGLIDAMSMLTQRIAYEAASDLLYGNPGNEPRFWNDDFDTWIINSMQDSSSKFIDRLDTVVGQWTESMTSTVDENGNRIPGVRFSFCRPPDPYTLKLSLGIGQTSIMGPGVCNLKKVAENFEKISDMVESGEALQLHKPTVAYGSSDLSVGVETNSQYFQYLMNRKSGLENIRKEDSGFRPVLDAVSGKIKVPTQQAQDAWMKLSPVALSLDTAAEQRGAILSNYFMVGLENIPLLALNTFTNTLLVGLLHKWLDPQAAGVGESIATAEQTRFLYESLKNQDASGDAMDLYERKEFAKALGDYLIPNFTSNEDLDIIDQLTMCSIPRQRFNCAMDQALGVAIKVGTREGALTVGRAAGLGSEGTTFSPSSQALHADWELIPETDMKNNTDPSCAQRAYCAGNLKKMRLARIIPIGWEMAANSPNNIKHDGRYVTLGEVIRGFYDCNAEGKLDKDHPWCHLIDPNWILTSPNYQCRAKGYGDAILPDVGSRLEECGDMVSCLKTSQTGECVGGYGYCLAERPAWRFESKECSQNFVSCRTYTYAGGDISLLRNTTDKGKCSEENMGCSWYATQRYVTTTKTPDGLWVGNATSGPRMYLDRGVQKCSDEGCTKVYQTSFGQSALNLIGNGSFEDLTMEGDKVNEIAHWENSFGCNTGYDITEYVFDDAKDGARSIGLHERAACSDSLRQVLPVVESRSFVFSFEVKGVGQGYWSSLEFLDSDGAVVPGPYVAYGPDCVYGTIGANHGIYPKDKALQAPSWQRHVCQFQSPSKSTAIRVTFRGGDLNDALFIDNVKLEEGEVVTPFVNGLATGLKEMYLKIAPDEYACTGNDKTDNPACQRFARVCRQIDVGCQGYSDVEDTTAPEVPAMLTPKDLCPAMCKGYGEYRKLASAFDLVKDPSNPSFHDPDDETSAYFIPDLSEKCSLESLGCEAFTSMEAASSTGERVSYFNDIRLCEKPNSNSATYYTWEGSESTGYQLKTWSLISSATSQENVAKSAPKTFLRGGLLGYIKDPASCNDVSWKLGSDPDCRQFYDATGNVYYHYYSQTISSDVACTAFRKDDSTEADCTKTGGTFFGAAKSCTYNALPSESNQCSAIASGCRAYLGPTGRNSVNVFRDTFATGTEIVFEGNNGTQISYSGESVIVGDKSLKLENNSLDIDVSLKRVLSSTGSLARISFWAKTMEPRTANDLASRVFVNGTEVGSFYPDVNWARFEVGPFKLSENPMVVRLSIPKKVAFIDTFSVDQLNDVQFVLKNHWAIPLACDSTPEGLPEPRYMVGCREYQDRDGNPAFVRNFSRLCRDTAIGCKAFIDTDDKSSAYPETKTLKGTEKPQAYAKGGDAKTYEEQFFGDWSVTSGGYRYYYAIDDGRGRCDSSQASCRAYGKPVFQQDRLQLAATTYAVGQNEGLSKQQKSIYRFETILLKEDWDGLLTESGDPALACRKDELFCDRFQSGKVTEYFRDPGVSSCVWKKVTKLSKNDQYGIPSDGEYGGWFREGTDIPCYPNYLASGNNFLMQYTSEPDYAGWGAKCPVDQSECTELVDPNDTSDPGHPNGRSYYIINGPKLDKSSCGGVADPLSGCVLFRDMGIGSLQANSQATYAKVMAEKGAPQTPIDCNLDSQNPYCVELKNSSDLSKKINICISKDSSENGKPCEKDSDCVSGTCKTNDSNLVLKVKMDRECARWMGCRTGETVYDAAQQKFVTQCSKMELCQKNGSTNDDVYCAEFTERNPADFLSVGRFVTPESYSARTIGFGKMDYSGYVSPYHYLVPDAEPKAIGSDLLKSSYSQLADKYRNDKRLMAKLPKAQTKVLNGERCQDPQTNRIGYLDADYCYLPISEDQYNVQSGSQQMVNLDLDADNLAEVLSRGINFSNAKYQASFPSPECQLFPEEGSPLQTTFVKTWDTSTNPPIPKELISGYEHANTCVYGEDCSCSYRKVRYSTGDSLFYGMDGASPMIGICKGGPRNGQPCVNRPYTPTLGGKVLLSQEQMGSYDVCGEGGICQEIQDVVYVNGKYGYCFERDLTRTIDASQALAPCLTWLPLAPTGKFNANHNVLTSGYMPAQGRGEYYCVSGTQGQSVDRYDHSTDERDKDTGGAMGKDFMAPGSNSAFQCSYRRVMNQSPLSLSDGKYITSYVNGGSNRKYSGMSDDVMKQGVSNVQMGDSCQRAMMCQGDWEADKCTDAEGLWIQAGPQIGNTYSEYFVPYLKSQQTFRDQRYYDYTYGLFNFSLVKSADGSACKWHPGWIGQTHPSIPSNDFSCSSFLSEVQTKSNEIYEKFKQDFPGILDRRSEEMVRDTSGAPLRLKCVLSSDGEANTGCYYKYWEANYNVKQGDKRFEYPRIEYEQQIGKKDPQSVQFFNPSEKVSGACESDHPYFGIRAVFQNVNLQENTYSSEMIEGRGLSGPWQFVGFWVTACMPYAISTASGGSSTDTDNFLLYMKLQSTRVDVCTKVAQTADPEKRENVAFTDRIWSSGDFIVPYIGAKYVRYNEPFGSAIAAATISSDPMVVGDSIPVSSDPRKTPTFPDAGQGMSANFVSGDMDAWFSLTNLFARVYNIYSWDVNQVYPDTPICKVWPGKVGDDLGSSPLCTNLNNDGQITPEEVVENIKMCSGWNDVSPVTDQSQLSSLWKCNALSGVNRGLSCGKNTKTEENSDPVCHNAPVMFYEHDAGSDVLSLNLPLYGSCVPKMDGAQQEIAIQKLNTANIPKEFKLSTLSVKPCSAYYDDFAVSDHKITVLSTKGGSLKTLSQIAGAGSVYDYSKQWADTPEKIESIRKKAYQELVLTPENIQETIYNIISFSIMFRDLAYDKAYVSCGKPTAEEEEYFINDTVANGQGIVLSLSRVAKYLVKYIEKSTEAKVTVGSYASRSNTTDPAKPDFDEVAYMFKDEKDVSFYIAKKYAQIMMDGGEAHIRALQYQGFPPVPLPTDDIPSLSTLALLQAIVQPLSSQYDDKVSLIPNEVYLGNFNIESFKKKNLVYVCGDDSVEPGKLCRPDARPEVTFAENSSVDCPKAIKPSALTVINNASDLSKIFLKKEFAFTYNTQGGVVDSSIPGGNVKTINIPQEGFCFKGFGSGSGSNDGRIMMDRNQVYDWIGGSGTYIDDTLQEVLPGTGYCLGFNKFSRCTKNADCQFSNNNWWGLYDQGGGYNDKYYSGLWELKIFDNGPNTVDPVSPVRRINLPTPYTPNEKAVSYNDIEKKFKLYEISAPPAVLNDFLLPTTEYLFGFKSFLVKTVKSAFTYDIENSSYDHRTAYQTYIESCNTEWYCRYSKELMVLYENIWRTIPFNPSQVFGDGSTSDYKGNSFSDYFYNGEEGVLRSVAMQRIANYVLREAMQWSFRLSYFLLPTQYANQFEQHTLSVYQNNNKAYSGNAGSLSGSDKLYRRAVTLAPFAVNPWERFIRSLGMSAFIKLEHENDTDGLVDEKFLGQDDVADGGLWHVNNYIQTFYEKGRLMMTQTKFDDEKAAFPGSHFIADSKKTMPDPVLNASFPWKKLFFTNLFPLINKEFVCQKSGFPKLQPWEASQILNSNAGNTPSYGFPWQGRSLEFYDLCENFGFSAVYSTALKDWFMQRLGLWDSGIDPIAIAQSNIKYSEARNKTMQYDYYDKTGWGLAMEKDHPDFNLYPGVIPAGLGYDNEKGKYVDDDKYDIYLPGHCEPAVGTEDSSSKFKSEKLRDDFPFSTGQDGMISDYDDDTFEGAEYQIGPKTHPSEYETSGQPNTKLNARLFLMPWHELTYNSNLEPLKDFPFEKGYQFRKHELKFFNATVNLSGNDHEAVNESDFRGYSNGEPIGSIRGGYKCERTGEIVEFERECNKNLIGTEWDVEVYEQMLKDNPQQILNKTIMGTSTTKICDIPANISACIMKPGSYLPPDYNDICNDNLSDMDKDCNSCTHKPGFRSIVNKPLAYELGNPLSTNLLGQAAKRQYPSATDVTFGLDTFKYLAGYSNTYNRGELIASYQPLPPRVAAPDALKISNSANAQPVYYLDTFSVNSQIKGVVYLGSGHGVATLRFYAWSAHDQAPLREIVIDWGDGEVTRVDDAKLKNHKPICNSDMECTGVKGLACTNDSDCPVGGGSCMKAGRCEGTNQFCYITNTYNGDCGGNNVCKPRMMFGNSSEACQQGYFEFSHVYKTMPSMQVCGSSKRCQYEPNKLEGNCRADAVIGEIALDRLAPSNGCYDADLKMLRFTPRIMVTDNWGWCTGNCSESKEREAKPVLFDSNKPETFGGYGDANRYEIRHPNKGCWDGSSVSYNTDPLAKSTFGVIDPSYPGKVIESECSENNTRGRPWVVFQGSVELTAPTNYTPKQ